MVQLNEIIEILESVAPLGLQESYDNAGLITGNLTMKITKAMLCLDSTEDVVDEAILKGCNLIIAHHPIVFGGLKKFTGSNYVEQTIIKAIKNDIAIYAIHTNLDNVLNKGVNEIIAKKLGLTRTKILSPKASMLSKIQVYTPGKYIEVIESALFNAGAGSIGNYTNCSYKSGGEGSFIGNEHSNPSIGLQNQKEIVKEVKLEVIIEKHKINKAIKAMKEVHPYEEMAYDVIPLENIHQEIGSGIIGELKDEMPNEDFLKMLKKAMNTSVIRFTRTKNESVKTVAICGGSGSFLIKKARAAGADAYVTGDIKYHEFFDAENQILLCDIGHYESEQYTSIQIERILSEKMPNLAVIFTETDTNPVQYH